MINTLRRSGEAIAAIGRAQYFRGIHSHIIEAPGVSQLGFVDLIRIMNLLLNIRYIFQFVNALHSGWLLLGNNGWSDLHDLHAKKTNPTDVKVSRSVGNVDSFTIHSPIVLPLQYNAGHRAKGQTQGVGLDSETQHTSQPRKSCS
jgi:hypothetical protein